MSNKSKDNFFVYGLSILLSVVVLVVLLYILKIRFETQIDEDATESLARIDKVSFSVVNTLNELNKVTNSSCDDDVLLAMRKQLFISEYIKDVGFFEQDYLTCTTGLGALNSPFKSSEPDFTGRRGVSVWFKQKLVLFDREITGTLFRDGRFNVVIDKKVFNDLLNTKAEWELVLANEQGHKSMVGQSGLYDLVQSQQANKYLYTTTVCSDNFSYCFTIAAPLNVLTEQHKLTAFAFVIISILTYFVALSRLRLRLIKYRSIESRIKRGMNNNAFYCLYQPIVSLSDNRIVGCEVLARYRDSEGTLSPLDFIPVVNQLGFSWRFTRLIIDNIKQELSPALKADAGFKININFFAHDLSSGNILELVNQQLLSNDYFQYVVEVTEDEELARKESSIVFAKLAKHGFQIAIDDFGTGYSNLSQVKGFNCSTLKIDRSFVNEMEDKSIRSTLIPSIVEIAKKIDADIVAEGIENKMQHQELKDVGVQFGQGWFFGKPMSVAELNLLIVEKNKALVHCAASTFHSA